MVHVFMSTMVVQIMGVNKMNVCQECLTHRVWECHVFQ